MNSSPNTPVAIVGGGISGLATAYYLSKRGIDSTVIEARPYLGGVLRTEYIDGCTVETGADSWLASKTAAAELARELGLGSEIIGSNDAIRRIWIWKNGSLVPFPDGMHLVAPTRFGPIWNSQMFNASTKMRMALDWFRMPARRPLPERSVAAFVRDHFGQEAVDYVAEPLLTGIYGGDAEELSASSAIPKLVAHERVHGSLVRGLRAVKHTASVFQSLRGGLGSLPAALAPTNVKYGRVEYVERVAERFRVRLNGDWLTANSIVLACESHEAARLVEAMDPVLAADLKEIRHSSGHIVAMAFRRTSIAHPLNGFGFLVPRCEGRNLTAATWVTSKFSDRAPKDLALIRAFFRERPSDPAAEIRKVMGMTGEPIFVKPYEWPDSLAQYRVGHAGRVAAIDARVKETPELYLVGNAYHGVGIPDCVRLARSVANSVDAR